MNKQLPRAWTQEGLFRRLSHFFSSLLSASQQPAVTLAPGDAFLYDSRQDLWQTPPKAMAFRLRLLHLTKANRRYDRTAAVLVFRYDFDGPPKDAALVLERQPSVRRLSVDLWRLFQSCSSSFHLFFTCFRWVSVLLACSEVSIASIASCPHKRTASAAVLTRNRSSALIKGS